MSDSAPPVIAVDDGSAELRHLLRLAIPIAVAQLGLVSMGLVDTAIVGHTSRDDLAAVALARTILFTAASCSMGVSFALEPLASQAVGAGEPERAWGALRSALRACALITVPTIALAFAVTFLLAPMGFDAALVPRVQRCLAGNAPGTFAFVSFLCGKTFLQAHGETRPALVASVVANLVNAVVCSVLVRGDDALLAVGLPGVGLPHLGSLGAGLAQSVAHVTMAAIVLRAASRRRPAAHEPVPLRTLYRIGLPIGMQLLAEIGVFGLVGLLAGRFGALVMASHHIAMGLASFTFMGALGVAGATGVRVGNAIGAGRSPRRAGLLGLGVGATVMCVSALAFAAAPRFLISLFTSDPEIIAIGADLLRIAALFQLFDGTQAIAAGALRGAGDVRIPFLANVAAHWFFGLPIALTLAFGFGLGAQGLWWGLTGGLVAVAVLLVARFVKLSGRRIERL